MDIYPIIYLFITFVHDLIFLSHYDILIAIFVPNIDIAYIYHYASPIFYLLMHYISLYDMSSKNLIISLPNYISYLVAILIICFSINNLKYVLIVSSISLSVATTHIVIAFASVSISFKGSLTILYSLLMICTFKLIIIVQI
jgi:hypothetical protein